MELGKGQLLSLLPHYRRENSQWKLSRPHADTLAAS